MSDQPPDPAPRGCFLLVVLLGALWALPWEWFLYGLILLIMFAFAWGILLGDTS